MLQNTNEFRKDFPLLCNQNIAYLDNAATSQRPFCVIDAEKKYYETLNANPLRGFYKLATDATDAYESSRETVREFINAKKSCEIIFTRNTSESINLVAYSYGLNFLGPDDEILVTILEHHSNLLPWQMVSRQTGAKLKFLECDKSGKISEEEIASKITKKTKFAAIQHVSNVLGVKNPVERIIELVHANGGVVLVDGAQSTPHMPIDVQSLDADFFAFSGHKLMAPMGIGVLYGKEELLSKMPPFLSGGEMIQSVTKDSAVYAELPHKFEAGTVNGGGAYALEAAIKYIESIGFDRIEEIEKELTIYAFNKMKEIPGVHILGSENPEEHNGILSFTVDLVHPHDVAEILSSSNVCIRAGHHCAQPLLKHLGVMSCSRASLYFYNTKEEIDKLIDNLSTLRRKMGIER